MHFIRRSALETALSILMLAMCCLLAARDATANEAHEVLKSEMKCSSVAADLLAGEWTLVWDPPFRKCDEKTIVMISSEKAGYKLTSPEGSDFTLKLALKSDVDGTVYFGWSIWPKDMFKEWPRDLSAEIRRRSPVAVRVSKRFLIIQQIGRNDDILHHHFLKNKMHYSRPFLVPALVVEGDEDKIWCVLKDVYIDEHKKRNGSLTSAGIVYKRMTTDPVPWDRNAPYPRVK